MEKKKKVEIEEKQEEKGETVEENADLKDLVEEAVKSVEDLEKERKEREKDKKECEKEIDDLRKELDEVKKENEDLKDKLLRLAADFDNYRKRVEKEKEEIFNYGHTNLIKDILLVIDNLERAIEAAETKRDIESLLEGVKLTLNSFWSTIKKYGVEPLEAEGKPFDPTYHEAMNLVETDEVEPGIVVKEYQRGYMIKDRLLRPSRVAVSSAPQKTAESSEKGNGKSFESEEEREE